MRSFIVLLGMLGAVDPIGTQSVPQPPETAPPARVTLLNAAQLDQLTAPIALYADPLLGQILAAATYPLEIVEAARWLEDPAHSALKGSELAAALQPLTWDLSVKSLVPFPDVLRNLNNNLEWTEQLGDAFLAQQADVMDSIQRLRQRAAAAGRLRSTPQAIVTTEDNDITISTKASLTDSRSAHRFSHDSVAVQAVEGDRRPARRAILCSVQIAGWSKQETCQFRRAVNSEP